MKRLTPAAFEKLDRALQTKPGWDTLTIVFTPAEVEDAEAVATSVSVSVSDHGMLSTYEYSDRLDTIEARLNHTIGADDKAIDRLQSQVQGVAAGVTESYKDLKVTQDQTATWFEEFEARLHRIEEWATALS